MLTGLFWCLTLRATGNLWFAVGMHASFDFGETFLYSVPDSGMVFPGHLSNATLAGPRWLTGGSAARKPAFATSSCFFIFLHISPALPGPHSELTAVRRRLTHIGSHLLSCTVCYTGALYEAFRQATPRARTHLQYLRARARWLAVRRGTGRSRRNHTRLGI